MHVLGGNQGDAVSITRIPKDRLSEMRWPEGFPLPKPQVVVLDAKGAPVTKGEA